MNRIFPVVPDVPAEADCYRRLVGFLLGFALGLTYTLVSQGINHLLLPGMPLYQPPLGLWGNIGLGALWGGVLGLICAWPYSTAVGIVLATVVSVVVQVTRNLVGIDESMGRLLIVAIVLNLPMAFLIAPAMAALRLATNRLVATRGRHVPVGKRLRGPILLLAIVAILSVFSLYTTKARTLLVRMNEMLQASLVAGSPPEGLRLVENGDFPIGEAYTLEWTETDLDRFIELRPATNYSEHSAVIARFDNGHTLVCLYPNARAVPNCWFRDVPSAVPARPRFSED